MRFDKEKFLSKLIGLSSFLRLSGFGLMALAVVIFLFSGRDGIKLYTGFILATSCVFVFGAAWAIAGKLLANQIVMYGDVSRAPIILNIKDK